MNWFDLYNLIISLGWKITLTKVQPTINDEENRINLDIKKVKFLSHSIHIRNMGFYKNLKKHPLFCNAKHLDKRFSSYHNHHDKIQIQIY